MNDSVLSSDATSTALWTSLSLAWRRGGVIWFRVRVWQASGGARENSITRSLRSARTQRSEFKLAGNIWWREPAILWVLDLEMHWHCVYFWGLHGGVRVTWAPNVLICKENVSIFAHWLAVSRLMVILARGHGSGKVDKQCTWVVVGRQGVLAAETGIWVIPGYLCCVWRVLWKPHIPSGAVGRVDGPWHASPEMLELLPSVCQVHPQPGFGLPWQVCLGLLRPVSVAIQQWEQLPLDVMFRRILCPGQVGRNVQAGSYSPAIEEVNARQGRYLLIGPGSLQDSTYVGRDEWSAAYAKRIIYRKANLV